MDSQARARATEIRSIEAKIGRIKAVAQPGLCQDKMRLSAGGELDARIRGWFKLAFGTAGV